MNINALPPPILGKIIGLSGNFPAANVCRYWNQSILSVFNGIANQFSRQLGEACFAELKSRVLDIKEIDSKAIIFKKIHRYCENLFRFMISLGWENGKKYFSITATNRTISLDHVLNHTVMEFNLSVMDAEAITSAYKTLQIWQESNQNIFDQNILLLNGLQLTDLPYEINLFKNLRRISLLRNNFHKIPPYLFTLSKPTTIYLEKSLIESIPGELPESQITFSANQHSGSEDYTGK